MKKISLCMILKNEAKTIEQSLQSVIPIIDEFIIGIDKSTTDLTAQIVEKTLANHIHVIIEQFEWQDDFAKARNHFIDKASNPYVFILDGHEYLTTESISYLEQFKKTDAEPDVVDVNVFIQRDNGSQSFFQQPRLFRNHIRYDYAIHNTILHMDNRTVMPQVIIMHDQPAERQKARIEQKAGMNVRRLEKLYEQTGESRHCFYIGNTYYEQGKFGQAIDWYKRYITESTFESERYQARLFLSECYKKSGMMEKSKDVLFDCFQDESYRNEHMMALGDYYYERGHYRNAEHYYRLASSISLPMNFFMIEKDFYTWLPWHKIMQACMKQGDVEGTLSAIKKGKVIAPEVAEFQFVEKRIKEELNKKSIKKKGNIYFVATHNSFIIPIVEYLQKDYHCILESKFNPQNAKFAKLIWCEWADHNAIAVSNYETQAKKILRLHSYEAFVPDFMNHIKFENFDRRIYVARHIEYRVLNHINGNSSNTEKHDHDLIIPNSINLDNYYIAENKTSNNKIAWAGYLRSVKGIQLLLHIANEFNDYEFHIAGLFQEKDLEEFFKYYIDNNNLNNVISYPWQSDLTSFFEDKTYIISTSFRESTHLTVLEGMACGLQPLIYDWPGCKDIYSDNWIWAGHNDLKNLLTKKVNFQKNRQFIRENYSDKKWLPKIEELIEEIYNEIEV